MVSVTLSNYFSILRGEPEANLVNLKEEHFVSGWGRVLR